MAAANRLARKDERPECHGWMNVTPSDGDRGGQPAHEDFRVLLISVLPRLRRFCIALAGYEAGDDLCQATVTKALVNHAQFQPGSSPAAWLFRIARNQHIDHLRRTKTRGIELEMEVAERVAGDDGVRTLEGRSDLDHVRAAYLLLSDEQREVMSLVVIDGQSYRDTAEILGIPVGTVMSRLARARQALDRSLHQEPAE